MARSMSATRLLRLTWPMVATTTSGPISRGGGGSAMPSKASGMTSTGPGQTERTRSA